MFLLNGYTNDNPPSGQRNLAGCSPQTQLSDWAWACTLKTQIIQKSTRRNNNHPRSYNLKSFVKHPSRHLHKKIHVYNFTKNGFILFQKLFSKNPMQNHMFSVSKESSASKVVTVLRYSFYSYTKIYSAPQLPQL